MSDRVLIQEFVGSTTYIADGDDLETASRYMQHAMLGQPGCFCMTNADRSRTMVVYGGPDFEEREMSTDLVRAMCSALGLSFDDFLFWISSEKSEGGASC